MLQIGQKRKWNDSDNELDSFKIIEQTGENQWKVKYRDGVESFYSGDVLEEHSSLMLAICRDNSHTWRNTLTIGKEYIIIEQYNDPHAGYPMIKIEGDDGEIAPYRADRFDIKASAIQESERSNYGTETHKCY